MARPTKPGKAPTRRKSTEAKAPDSEQLKAEQSTATEDAVNAEADNAPARAADSTAPGESAAASGQSEPATQAPADDLTPMTDPSAAPATGDDQPVAPGPHTPSATPLPAPPDTLATEAVGTDKTAATAATGDVAVSEPVSDEGPAGEVPTDENPAAEAPSEAFAAVVIDGTTTTPAGPGKADGDAADGSTTGNDTRAAAGSATPWQTDSSDDSTANVGDQAMSPIRSEAAPGSKDAPGTADTVAAPPPARSAFLPLVLGGVIAAGIGFGAAQFLGPMGTRTADLSAQLSDLDGRVTLMSGELTTQISGASDAATDAALAELAPRLDALSARLDEQDARLAALTDRDTLEAQIADALAGIEPRVSEQVATTLAGPLADLERLRDDIAARQDGLREDIESLRALAETRLADAEAEADAAAQRAARTAARLAVADVITAFDTGAAFDTALPQIGAADVDIPPALSEAAGSGVPTLTALQDSFTVAARRALAQSLRSAEAGSVTDRVTLFLRSQTNARSLAAREGNDPDAVLSRAEAALRAGRVADAITELDALPDEGRAAMADWIAEARLRADALDGLNALQNQLTAE